MPAPDFTIIIPTRNGIRYLPFAIDSVLSQREPSFELIVSDNHSSDGTAEYLRSIDDPRLRRIKPPTLLSMVDHFEFAVAAATGTWVTTLGDDDGIMPFFFQNLRLLDLRSIRARAIVFRRGYYFWEGCGELHGDQVVIYYPFPRKVTRGNRWSLFLCLCSVIDYMYLPQLYTTGLVRRDFIEAIKRKTGGRFFHGDAPDAASAVALALNAPAHYRVEEPIFWTGTSPKSTGFSQASTEDKARAREFDDLNGQTTLKERRGLPAKLRAHFDFAVLLYDSLLAHPSSGAYWRSGLIRHCFFAGLILKDRDNVARLQDAFGPSFELARVRRFIPLVRWLKRRHDRAITRRYMADKTLSLHSADRDRFRTMTEASDAVLRIWVRLRHAHRR